MNFHLRQAQSIKYIQFLSASEFPNLHHGLTLRSGGFSHRPFHSLNFGKKTDDLKPSIDKNYKKFFVSLDIPQTRFCQTLQVHGSTVIRIKKNTPIEDYSKIQADALITNLTGTYLAMTVADCLPIFFFHHHEKVIGLAHAGWRGTLKKIAVQTIRKLGSQFKLPKNEFSALLGPSIGECCFKVGQEIYNCFSPSARRKKMRINLQAENALQLRKEGIPVENIRMINLCTSCHQRWFFSYRRDQGKTGRMLAFIGIRNEANDK